MDERGWTSTAEGNGRSMAAGGAISMAEGRAIAQRRRTVLAEPTGQAGAIFVLVTLLTACARLGAGTSDLGSRGRDPEPQPPIEQSRQPAEAPGVSGSPGSPASGGASAAAGRPGATPPDPAPSPAPADRGQPQGRQEVPAGFPARVASVAFDVRVRPPGQAEIAGFVRDRDGNPVGRACVELMAPGGRVTSPVFTSGQGNFRFTRVPAGLARVTMTVEELAVADRKRIADYHNQDPRLTVMLRPLVLTPADGRVEVLQVKREGDLGQGDGTRWVEVAPLALNLQGYSPACRRALSP
jgi:hypothetical protein